MYDKIIANGTVVTETTSTRADIAVKDGKISAIGTDLGATKKTIDASGCLLLPGGVDVHTHLDLPVYDFFGADDFETGTIAAACGGTTTIIDFAHQMKGMTIAETIDLWNKKAVGKASIDYGYHMIVTDMTDAALEELNSLPAKGITSYKIFMAYRGAQMVDDEALLKALHSARENGALVMVHAEHGDAIYYLQQQCLKAGKNTPKYHALSRPPRVEAEATSRAIALAEVVGAPLFVVHLTCREALDEVVRGKARGVEVMAETCTQYLYTTKEDLDRPGFEGAKWVFSPPARSKDDHETLWKALEEGVLENVSSDHAASLFNGKKNHAGTDDFTLIPNGAPGIEERLTMIWQGVRAGRISQEKFVEITATRPAKVFGLYPQKGALIEGADADIVIWDPEATLKITNGALHHAVDFTLFEGFDVVGLPRTVLLRGEVIVEDREWVGTVGAGQFLRRKPYERKPGTIQTCAVA